MTTTPAPETEIALESLLRLSAGGLASVPRLEALCIRGDWKTRSSALSALGVLIRDDPTAWRPSPFRHLFARHVPGLRDRFRSTGPHGAFARGVLVNSLGDRSWIVRTAAALAVGECRDAGLVSALEPLLRDHYHPVRLAAAAALAAAGRPPADLHALLRGSEPAPPRIGDTASSVEWLQRLGTAHRGVLEAWPPLAGGGREGGSWGLLLAGEGQVERAPDVQAEVLRYAQEKENHYNFTKPFTPGHRDQNVRLIHSFLVVAENMRVPQRGRVLDLGGGAAWVSELLAKLGYRPFTLDVAQSLLRVGRDRFTREHLPQRFTAADMTALPFASGSFDAVVVIDALHHVPDTRAVFREAHRVLAEGGQFLLAEPGEGHAESEKSRAEILEFGVCEGEIHLFDVVRYGREAGFDGVRVVPHFVPTLTFTPEDLVEAMRAPTERWTVRDGDIPRRFDEHLLQSIFCHPVLVFGKGRRRLDSRTPGQLRARVEAQLGRAGARVRGTATVINEGDTLWLAGGDVAGRVRLGIQLMTPERRLLSLDFARAELRADLPAGEAAEVPVEVTLPDAAAPYVLKLDLVDEHVCWFEDVGSRPLYVAV